MHPKRTLGHRTCTNSTLVKWRAWLHQNMPRARRKSNGNTHASPYQCLTSVVYSQWLEMVLHFFAHGMDICPFDSLGRLRKWGEPSLKEILPILKSHCHQSHPEVEQPKQWGKPFTKIWQLFADIAWPSTHNRGVYATRTRSIYGFRVR